MQIMSTTTTPITAEQLYALGDIGRCELIDGEIIHVAPAGAEHGHIAGEIFRRIANHVAANKLGKVYAAETGFTIRRKPDVTRAPDAAFVRNERLPRQPRRGFFEGAPDLAVEVVSPNDALSAVKAKVDDWLASGATSVWVVDPPNQTIEIYRQGNVVLRYRHEDELRDEPTLPGFTLKLADVFAAAGE
jgi:Uma2 family endonuclease